MRIRRLRQRKLAIDLDFEPASRVMRKQVGNTTAQLFGAGNVVGKMRTRKKYRTRLGQFERLDGGDKPGRAAIVDA